MPAYAIGYLTIDEPERYAQYIADFMPILASYGGKVLLVDDNVEVLEGDPPAGRHVILEFADAAAARRWYSSPEYQRILQHRLAASTTHFVAIAQTPRDVQAWIESAAR